MKKYVFKPYSIAFPNLFAAEQERIIQLIPECIDVQHVGSTAVPGLGGKGIIDIAIATHRGAIDGVSRKLTQLGYLFRESGSSPERWFFRVDLPDKEEGIRRYHVHLTFPESLEWKELIVFRDYLRMHPDAAERYSCLKKQAAEHVNEDGAQYRRQKDPFFKEILHHAHQENAF